MSESEFIFKGGEAIFRKLGLSYTPAVDEKLANAGLSPSWLKELDIDEMHQLVHQIGLEPNDEAQLGLEKHTFIAKSGTGVNEFHVDTTGPEHIDHAGGGHQDQTTPRIHADWHNDSANTHADGSSGGGPPHTDSGSHEDSHEDGMQGPTHYDQILPHEDHSDNKYHVDVHCDHQDHTDIAP